MHNPQDTEAFIRLLSEHERGLYMYVMTMTPHASDTDDILQEAKVVMWRHFGDFKQGTNFGAWGEESGFLPGPGVSQAQAARQALFQRSVCGTGGRRDQRTGRSSGITLSNPGILCGKAGIPSIDAS